MSMHCFLIAVYVQIFLFKSLAEGAWHDYYHSGAPSCGFNEFLDHSDYIRKFAYNSEDPGPHSFSFPSDGTNGMKARLSCVWIIDPGRPWNAIRMEFLDFQINDDENKNHIIISQVENGNITQIDEFRSASRPFMSITSAPGNLIRVKLVTEVDSDDGTFTIEFYRFQAAMWGGPSVLLDNNNCAHCRSDPCFYDHLTKSCYILKGTNDNEKKTYDEAFEACGPNGHLAFVQDRRTFDLLKDNFKEHTRLNWKGPWIGLKQSNTTDVCEPSKCWSWMLPNGKHWDAERGKTAWMHGEPNGIDGHAAEQFHDCGALFYKGRPSDNDGLNDDVCSYRKEYICQEEVHAGCPQVYQWLSENETYTITSPGWPEESVDSTNCYYILETEQHRVINLTIHNIQFDEIGLLSVYESNDPDYKVRWNKETPLPATYLSMGSKLRIRFSNGEAGRFHATASKSLTAECECSGKTPYILSDDGKWVDINPVTDCGGRKKCSWIIKASTDYTIECSFLGSRPFGIVHEFIDLNSSNTTFIHRYFEDQEHSMRNAGKPHNMNSNYIELFSSSLTTKYVYSSIKCHAIAYSTQCNCPKVQHSTQGGTIKVWHEGANCTMDCVYLLYPPDKDTKYEIRLNYSTKFSPYGYLTRGPIFSDSERHWRARLPVTDSQWQQRKYEVCWVGGEAVRLYYHNNEIEQIQGFDLTFTWHEKSECEKIKLLVALDEYQEISSPGFPEPYSTNMKCSWYFEEDNKGKILFQFDHLNLEEHYDNIFFYETSNASELFDIHKGFTGVQHSVAAFEMDAAFIVFEAHGHNLHENMGFKLRYKRVSSETASTAAVLDHELCFSAFSVALPWAIVLFLCFVIVGWLVYNKRHCSEDKGSFLDGWSYSNLLEVEQQSVVEREE